MDITNGIVRILDENNQTIGTGFLIDKEGHIVTCSHVIIPRESQKENTILPAQISFQFLIEEERNLTEDSAPRKAIILQKWLPFEEGDVVVLKFNGQLPKNVTPIPLGSSVNLENQTNTFRTHGYSERGGIIHSGSEGKIYARQVNSKWNFKVLELIDEDKKIGQGFSGAPVYNKEKKCIVGMVSWIVQPDDFNKNDKSVYAIPSELISSLYPQTIALTGAINRLNQEALSICRAQIDSLLHDGLGKKYIKELYIQRKIEKDINDFLNHDEKNKCFILVAPAGSGKTNLICHLASQYKERQIAILLVGNLLSLGKSKDISEGVAIELNNYKKLSQSNIENGLLFLANATTSKSKPGIVFIDGINEYTSPIEMRKALERFNQQLISKNLKAVITCRDYYWGMYKGSYWKKTLFSLPNEKSQLYSEFFKFSDEEYKKAIEVYLTYYRIKGKISGYAWEQCKHPLLLRFFCEAYKERDIGDVSEIRLKQLFDLYIERKSQSIAERMIQQGEEKFLDFQKIEIQSYLFDIALFMLSKQLSSISFSQIQQVTGDNRKYGEPKSIYSRIRDEFIILEEHSWRHDGIPESVTFVYEEFKEYCMAKALALDWLEKNKTSEGILSNIDSIAQRFEDSTQLIGVLIYLNVFITESWRFSLWEQLLSRSANWEKLILETIRKMPEEYFDEGVSNTIYEMLTNTQGSQKNKILDLFKTPKISRNVNDKVVQKVGSLAKVKDLKVRRRAIYALGFMPAKLSVPLILDSINVHRGNTQKWIDTFDGNVMNALARAGTIPALREIASMAMKVMTTNHVSTNGSRWSYPRLAMISASYLDEKGFSNLVELFSDPDDNIVRGALTLAYGVKSKLIVNPSMLRERIMQLIQNPEEIDNSNSRYIGSHINTDTTIEDLAILIVRKINTIIATRESKVYDYNSIIGKIVFYRTYFYGNHNYFFKVVRQTAKTAMLLPLRNEKVSGHILSGTEKPIDVEMNKIDKEQLVRATKTFNHKYPFSRRGHSLEVWDGTPQSYLSD